MSRIAKPGKSNHAFFWCSLLVIIVFSIPRISGAENLWMNGLYDSLTIIFIFPVIVYMGASGEVKGKFTSLLCKFFGDISYPIYIIHDPMIYIFTAWMVDNKVPMQDAWPKALLLIVSAFAVACGSLKLYDIPVQKWLAEKFIKKEMK